MSRDELYITGSCIIQQGRVYRNGALLMEAGPEQDLAGLLRAGYDRFSGQYAKFHKMDHLCKLGWLAAEVLLQDAPLPYPPEQVGQVLANRSASLDTDLRYYETVKGIPSPALFVYTLPNIVMGEISIRHGFKGENAFFTSETFNAPLMESYVKGLFAENALQACLCGWVEVLGLAYEARLFLVEKQAAELAKPFIAAAMEAGPGMM